MEIVNIFKVISLVLMTTAKAEGLTENPMKAITAVVNKSIKIKNNENLSDDILPRQSISLWPNIEQDQDLLLLEQVLQDIEKGRDKSYRYKKLGKFMYPLFMGVLVAKIILVPLILKMLTALSASAVVMSKIALITTGFVALKWIFSNNIYDTKDRLEFIYLPTSSNTKPYRSAAGGFSILDDQSWSDSNNQYTAVNAETPVQHKKFIPVTLKNEISYKSYRGGVNGDGWKSAAGVGNSVKDLYYYSQHNYNNNEDTGLLERRFRKNPFFLIGSICVINWGCFSYVN